MKANLKLGLTLAVCALCACFYQQSAFAVQPVLYCTPLGFTNSVSYGQNHSGQSFYLRNASGDPVESMNFSVTNNVSWLTVAPTAGASQGEDRRIDLLYDVSTLNPGVHTGVVTVTASGALESPQRVWVYMRVNANPILETDATGFENEIIEGDALANDGFDVWNDSESPYAVMAYSVLCSESWFSATVTNATNQGERDRVEIVYDTSELSPGTYTGAVTIVATDQATGLSAAGSPTVIPVILYLKGMPKLGVSVSGFTNEIVQSGIAESQILGIWNDAPDPGSMNYTLSESLNWLSLSSYSETVDGGVTNLVAINYQTSMLDTGVYSGVITIKATDPSGAKPALNSPKDIHVTLKVTSRRPVNLQPPYLIGVPKIGNQLSVNKGLWSPLDYIEFEYQWQRADNWAGDGLEDIAGATDEVYTVTLADRAKYLRVKVTGVDRRASPPMTTYAFSDFLDYFRVNAVMGDYDGDGRAEYWFYDTPEGMFRIFMSSGRPLNKQFGWNEAMPVVGDFDGDGICDLAVYHQNSGEWYIWTSGGRFIMRQFGWAEADPVPADYDGDGITDFAVYYQAAGMWYILLSSDGSFVTAQFGWHETVPVPADYDGDKIIDVAVYHQAAGMWYILESSTGITQARQFGWYETIPVPGDYNGDGADDLAVYHQAENTWYHIPFNGSVYNIILPFGTSTTKGIPVPGYYDGDGKIDPATAHFNDDFIVWCIQCTVEGYKGYSYQISLKRWR